MLSLLKKVFLDGSRLTITLASMLSLSLPVSARDLSSTNLKIKQLNYPEIPAEIINGTVKAPATVAVDPMTSQDWALSNIGFFEVFTPLVQPIKPGFKTCSKEVVVAVVDTGIDYTHPDLKDNIWTNKGETGPWKPVAGVADNGCRDKSCNGIDDDNNGFVDDVAGWDFVNDIPLPFDTHGHGTHIAGIIAAAAANGVGISGVCPQVTIMPLKYYDASGAGFNNLSNTVKAFRYAARMGAQIINYSGGGAEPAIQERSAVEESRRKGILFIAAAGNDGHSNDASPYYPASYPLDNIVSVASITREDKLLPSSNFGKVVQVAAPGLSILSTMPRGGYGTMSGTSQATAFVTGAEALLASQFPDKADFDYRLVKTWLQQGTRALPGDAGKSKVAFGIVSVPGSLKQAQGWKKELPAVALDKGKSLKPVVR